MKHYILAALFLITWQEYELKDNCDPGRSIISLSTNPPRIIDPCDPKIYTVETVDKSIKLKTQKDVGKEVMVQGAFNVLLKERIRQGGLIGPNAFNIKVKEIKGAQNVEGE